MSASVMASLALKPSPPPLWERPKIRGVRPSARPSLLIVAKAKKIQTAQPYGPGGGADFKDGVDASGRVAKGKGVYQFANKYGANVDGYSPIYTPEEWSPSGDVYVGGTHKTGISKQKCLHCEFLFEFFHTIFVISVNHHRYLHLLSYVGKTGLFLWAVTLAGILLGGALLVYNTSALAS
uniref:Uncharacterized protein n=1 Tax=Avena sativa TaxID=4498 RepID=A0ACD5UNV6_AVESA